MSRCPVWITVLKLWFSVWALAVSQSLRGLGSWLVAFIEGKDGKGMQLQHVRVLTPHTETAARPRISGP